MRSVEEIEKWVEDTLRLKGFDYGCKEEHVFLLLRHLLSAVAMYDELTAYDRKIVDVYQKKFKLIFNSKFSLKERKRNKREKEKVSPVPPLKDKENKKEIEQKTHPQYNEKCEDEFEKRVEAFRQECFSFSGQYDDSLITSFFNYFSQENKRRTKMRFESERFWNTAKRLEKWKENPISLETENATIRLEETKKRKTKTAAPVEKQQVVAAQREAENLKREQEYAENKRKAVSYEEVAKTMGEGGALAKLKRISSTPKK